MKLRLFTFLLLIYLFSCTNSTEKINFIEFPGVGLALRVDPNWEIVQVPTESVGYSIGQKYGISAYSSLEYEKNARQDSLSEYFAYAMYTPIDIGDQSFEDWYNECPLEVKSIERSAYIEEQDYNLYELKKFCYPLRIFVIHKDNLIYRFDATEETKAYDTIWDTLSHVEFLE